MSKESPSPLSDLERLALRGYAKFIQTPRQYRSPEDTQLEYNKLQAAIANGTPYTLQEMRERIYNGIEPNVQGAENIPASDQFVFATNHYNQGMHRGNWQMPVVIDALASARPLGKQERYSVIFTDSKDIVEGIDRAVTAVDKTIGKVLYTAPVRRVAQPGIDALRRRVTHILDNSVATLGLMSESDPRAIVTFLDQAGIIGICPSAEDELALKEGDPRAGSLFENCGKRGIPVLPIGCWHDPVLNEYYVNIGRPELHQRDRSVKDSRKQTVDAVMYRIADLLPRQLRGEYATVP